SWRRRSAFNAATVAGSRLTTRRDEVLLAKGLLDDVQVVCGQLSHASLLEKRDRLGRVTTSRDTNTVSPLRALGKVPDEGHHLLTARTWVPAGMKEGPKTRWRRRPPPNLDTRAEALVPRAQAPRPGQLTADVC